MKKILIAILIMVALPIMADAANVTYQLPPFYDPDWDTIRVIFYPNCAIGTADSITSKVEPSGSGIYRASVTLTDTTCYRGTLIYYGGTDVGISEIPCFYPRTATAYNAMQIKAPWKDVVTGHGAGTMGSYMVFAGDSMNYPPIDSFGVLAKVDSIVQNYPTRTLTALGFQLDDPDFTQGWYDSLAILMDLYGGGTGGITDANIAAIMDSFLNLKVIDTTTASLLQFIVKAVDPATLATLANVLTLLDTASQIHGVALAADSGAAGSGGADSTAVYGALEQLAADSHFVRADSTQDWKFKNMYGGRFALSGLNGVFGTLSITNTSTSGAPIAMLLSAPNSHGIGLYARGSEEVGTNGTGIQAEGIRSIYLENGGIITGDSGSLIADIVDSVWNEDSTGHYTSPNMAFTTAQTAASSFDPATDSVLVDVSASMADLGLIARIKTKTIDTLKAWLAQDTMAFGSGGERRMFSGLAELPQIQDSIDTKMSTAGGASSSNWSDTQRDSILNFVADANTGVKNRLLRIRDTVDAILDSLQNQDNWIASAANLTKVIDTANGIMDTLQNQDDWISSAANLTKAIDTVNAIIDTLDLAWAMLEDFHDSIDAKVSTAGVAGSTDTTLIKKLFDNHWWGWRWPIRGLSEDPYNMVQNGGFEFDTIMTADTLKNSIDKWTVNLYGTGETWIVDSLGGLSAGREGARILICHGILNDSTLVSSASFLIPPQSAILYGGRFEPSAGGTNWLRLQRYNESAVWVNADSIRLLANGGGTGSVDAEMGFAANVYNSTAADTCRFRVQLKAGFDAHTSTRADNIFAVVTPQSSTATAGSDTMTICAVDTSGTDTPIPGVFVSFKTKAGIDYVSPRWTDSQGKVTLVGKAGDSLILRGQLVGYVWSTSDTVRVVAGDSLALHGYNVAVGSPSSADLCRVYCYAYSMQGAAVAGAKLEFKLYGANVQDTCADVVPVSYTGSALSDATGYVYLDLIKSKCLKGDDFYEITLKYNGVIKWKYQGIVPDASSYQITN